MDPIQILMQQAVDASSPFEENSRYRNVQLASAQLPDGRQVSYVRRRFLPQPEEMATLSLHLVTSTDRLDQLSDAYYQDATRFWQICDSNRVLRPDDLIAENVNEQIRIGLPPGVPAPKQVI